MIGKRSRPYKDGPAPAERGAGPSARADADFERDAERRGEERRVGTELTAAATLAGIAGAQAAQAAQAAETPGFEDFLNIEVGASADQAPLVDLTEMALEDLMSLEAVAGTPREAQPQVDLTDLDLAELMTLEAGPAAAETRVAELDLTELGLEQLMALEATAPETGEEEDEEIEVTELTLEDLMDVQTDGAGGDGMTIAAGTDEPSDPDDGTLVDGGEEPVVADSDPVTTTTSTSSDTTVAPANGAPVALDDAYKGLEDKPITGKVLANDDDPDGDALTVTSTGTSTTAKGGSVTMAADGSFAYSPPADYSGPDAFSYTVSDGKGGTSSATVSLSIAPVNDTPTAAPDSVATDEDTAVTLDVLANDSDPDGDALGVSSVTQGANGSVAINPDGTVTYTPDAGFSGSDTFTYGLSDGNGGTGSATVTVTVAPVNDAPVAAADSVTTDEDTAVTFDVLANDSDPDGDSLSVSAVTQGANGSVAINPDGTVTYTPDSNFSGSDSFTYTVDDGNGGSSTETVTVTVAPVNDAPVAAADSVATDEDTAVTLDVLANDSDPDGDTLNVASVTQGANGSVAINPDGTVTYTPDADFSGSDTFSYTVSDGNGGSSTETVTVTVTPVNDAPIAVADSVSTDEDTAVTLDVLANDSDPDGDALSVSAVTQGANGSVAVNPDDTVTYTPDADFSGTDTFTYTVDDGNGGTSTETVTVTVAPVNDAPVAKADSVATDEDTAVTHDVLANDSDPDGDALSVIAVTQGANGTVAINPDGTVTYTPDSDFSGSDSFSYTVSDGNGGTSTTTVDVKIVPVNDAPLATDDTTATTIDNAVTLDVLVNDSDPDGDPFKVTAVTQGANGAVAINPDGTVTYTPDPGYSGDDSFSYTIDDGNGGTSTATVTVSVLGINSAPLPVDDVAATAADTAVTLDVLANDLDLEGDTLTVTAVTQGANGSVVINPDGTLTYTPKAGFTGNDSFTYTVDDGNGGSASAIAVVGVGNGIALIGTAAGETLVGTEGADDLDGRGGDDLLYGMGGNDYLFGSAGNDTLLGGAGDDELQGGEGADQLDGGAGFDLAQYKTSGAAIVVDLAAGTGSGGEAQGDSYVDVEGVLGSDFGDILIGDANNNELYGRDGKDSLDGGAGDDLVDGGVGSDSVSGGAGDDRFIWDATDSLIDGGTGNDTIVTGMGTADLTGFAGTLSGIEVIDMASDPAGTSLILTAADVLAISDTGTLTITGDAADSVDAGGGWTYDGLDGAGNHVYTQVVGGSTATLIVDPDVALTIATGNTAPVAQDDAVIIDPATGPAHTFDLLANDSDPDGDSLSITSVTQGANGSVAINPDGTVTYTPTPGLLGPDSFTYTVSDGAGGTSTATVTLAVPGGNVYVGGTGDDSLGGSSQDETFYGYDGVDKVTAGGGTDFAYGGAGDDTLLGGTGTDTLDGGAGNDTIEGGGNGDTLIGGAGADSMSGGGGADTASYSGSGSAVTVDLASGTGSGGDAQGDTLIGIENLAGSDFNDILTGDGGANVLDGGAGNDTLAGGLGADTLVGGAGDDILEWDAADATIDGGSGSDTLRVTGGDVDLTAFTGTVSGIEVIDLASDPGANSLTLAAADVLAISDTGTLTITGDAADSVDAGSGWIDQGVDGAGNHVYTQDLGGQTAMLVVDSTIALTIATANSAPVAVDDAVIIEPPKGITFDVLANDSDPDGDPLKITSVTQGAFGFVTINADNTVTYTPNPKSAFDGTDSFTYTVSDGNGGTATATVVLSSATVNGLPVAENDIATTGIDTAAIINVMANDSDPDGDPLALDSVTQGANGSVTINPDGTVTYTPNAGFTGSDSFDYIVIDGQGGAASATVIITVGDGISLKGTSGADTLVGTAGDDTLDGIGGNDILYGLDGNDTLIGRAGNDILDGGAGADSFDGGAGNDTVTYEDSAAGVTVDLAAGTASGGDAQGDSFVGMEYLVGSSFDDALTGDDALNHLTGGAGNDILDGGTNADTLEGGAGADILIGGAGTDVAGYGNSDAGVTVDLNTGLASGGHAEGDSLSGIEVLRGSAFDDVLTGSDGLNGLNGAGGNDILYGGGGTDQVSGNDGDDIVNGGTGDDFLDGNAGFDTFVFDVGTGHDTIRDYTSGEDVIDLTSYGLASTADLAITNGGAGNTLITLPGGDSITVQATNPADFTDTDFIF